MRTGLSRNAAALTVVVAMGACTDRTGTGPPGDDLVARFQLEPMPAMVHPINNLPDPAIIALGRLLFFDPLLSGHKDTSCGTCHLPEFGFSDGRDLPIGAFGDGLGPDRVHTEEGRFFEGRNSMTVVNVGFNRFAGQWTADGFLFWDGRKRRLENLVVLPLLEISEMRGVAYPPEVALDSVIERIRQVAEYRTLFAEAYPEVAAANAGVAVDSLTLTRAIAQFIRSLQSVNSRYDRYVAGDPDALSELEMQGLVLFHTKGGCAECHLGPMFSDFEFHVVGAKQLGPGFQETPFRDFGRWNATELEQDRWAFRTQSLRNVELTSPYMHSGGYDTLREVVEFFNRGGHDLETISASQLDELVVPLGLTDREIDAIVAFLLTLTDLPDVAVPGSVPSGLAPPILP